MKSYCYNLRNATNGQKIIGGMLHGNDMEDAARRAVKACKLKVVTRYPGTDFEQYDFHREDCTKVYLHLTVHPENIGLNLPVPNEVSPALTEV